MQAAKIHTTQYTFLGEGFFKPLSPVFEIRNDGAFDFRIGSSFIIKPQQTFSIDMERFVTRFKKKGYQVINDTQFDLIVSPPPQPIVYGPGDLIALAIWFFFLTKSFCSVKETQINL